MRHEIPRLDVTWPERYHADRAQVKAPPAPLWKDVEVEGHHEAALISMGFKQFPPPAFAEGRLSEWIRACPGPFDVNYVQSFFCLPSVMQYLTKMVKDYSAQIALIEQLERQMGHKIWTPSIHQEEIGLAFTELYTAYSVRRWEHYGKRMYVIDPDTFSLLANTELPRMPLSEVRGPHPTFWLQFPKDTYYFEADIFLPKDALEGVDPKNKNLQEVDGVMVSFSHTETTHTHQRQLTMVVGGRSLRSPSDDNIVYFNESLDERAIGSLWKNQDETGLLQGGYEIGVLTPRAVLNFCLYMMSEQPRLEPIPPIERRKFAEIRSPQQRMAALASQNAKLAKKTRLGYIYVGRLPQPLGIPQEEGSRRKWTLNKKVWVQGHWKFQAYGPQRTLRKLIHVPPYFKGKMFGEDVSAVRVQPAREVLNDE
jgi:hypothetical protein